MSTLVAPTVTAVDKIPLGRRIEEIKKEKGAYYSTMAMASRIGTNYETLRLMLKGKREIYTFELDKIAKDLKLPVERILQEDIKEETEILTQMLADRSDSESTLQLALKMMEVSIGLSESCNALRRLGIAYRYSLKFIESNKTLLKSHQTALKIHDMYGDNLAVYNVVYHLVASFTDIRDYSSASKLLNEVATFFVEEPDILSSISYQKAKIAEESGNINEAKQYAIESLHYAIQTGNQMNVARTKLNLSHYHFRSMEYQDSLELLEQAIEGLTDDNRTQLIARKELVKTLLKLGLKEQALSQIELAMEHAKSSKWLDMEGKLVILTTLATDNPKYAQAIMNGEKNSLKIRYLACRCLLGHFKTLNDASEFLHYSKSADRFCIDLSDFLDEGEL